MKTVFPNHFPAHESLQEFAARVGKSPRDAHKQWSNRSYPEFRILRREEDLDEVTGEFVPVRREYAHAARGPGLALRLADIAP